MMAQFHELEVTGIHNTIRDAVVVTLKPRNATFDFTQGQYLTFRQTIEGTEIRRSYSICAGRDDGILQVGIKKVEGGAFSTWANENLAPGDVVEAMLPAGSFHTPLNPEAHKTYLGFAGGSGITPVLSILKTTLAQEPHSRFTLIYANRGVHTIMFREELEDLKNIYMDRLTIIHILESDAQDIDLFTGRVDGAKCEALFANWVDIAQVDTAFICGPEPMMLGIVSSLEAHGMDKADIKYELFASGQPGRLAQKARSTNTSSQNKTQLRITIDGAERSVAMKHDQTVLQAALENALDAPFACTAGVCSTCKCKLVEGEVEMVANHALEDYEVENGFILSCQSYPISSTIVVDYDQH